MNTFFIVFAVVMLLCCVGPMLFMRKRRGASREDRKPGKGSGTDFKSDK